MRNSKLDSVLYSLAYDRGHYAGHAEVDLIYRELCDRFSDVDLMLPFDMPPKFEVGDMVSHYGETGVVNQQMCYDGSKHKCHNYLIEFDGYKLIIQETELDKVS